MNSEDVLTKYEKIFGPDKVRPTLYSPGDEQYQELRRFIINAPMLSYDRTKLPFSEIQMKKTSKIIRSQDCPTPSASIPLPGNDQNPGTFYIYKNSGYKEDYCFASGTYDKPHNYFTLKQGSILANNQGHVLLPITESKRRQLFIRKHCDPNLGTPVLIRDVVCLSPTIAAFMVTGHTCDGWQEWINADGAKLGDIFKKE